MNNALNASFPLNTVDNSIDTSIFVKEPARITSFIADVVAARLESQVIFNNVSTLGGSFLFNQTLSAGSDADDPGYVSPGGEFPVVGFDLGKDKTVPVLKSGSKFFVTDEALRRNDASVFQRGALKVANKIVKDIDGRGFKALADELKALGGNALTVNSTGWNTALGVAASNKTAKTGEGVITDNLIDATTAIEDTELGYVADTIIFSAKDEANVKKLFGVTNWKSILESLGINNVVKTKALPEGTAYVLNSGVVGVMGVEKPISTEQWREPATEKEWFQTSVTLNFGITDPLAVAQITNINK